jgi:hypothetical protein
MTQPGVTSEVPPANTAGGSTQVEVATPPARRSNVAGSGWGAGRITALGIGVLLVLVSLALLGGGGTALWADRTQRDGGYVTTDAHQFSASGSALVTEPTNLGSAGTGWLYAPGLVGNVRIRVTPLTSQGRLFVGIGPTSSVDQYLAGVDHTVISDFWSNKVGSVNGGAPNAAPGTQHFWVASMTGSGAQTLRWKPTDGTWSVVVMNADGRPGIHVAADLGARIPALPWVAVGLLVAGTVFLAGGALLTWRAVRPGRAAAAATQEGSE